MKTLGPCSLVRAALFGSALAVSICIGPGVIALHAQQSPTITVQPIGQESSAGSVVTFTVVAVGDEPLSYQWRKEGIDLVDGAKVSGATTAVVAISNVQGNEMGAYSVIVGNDSGEVQSIEAVLSIVPLVAWGGNEFGASEVPFGLSNVVSVAAGYRHSLALRADGTVAAWGNNSEGQSDPPPGLADVRAVATGWQHSLAVRGDGTVIGWGRNDFSQATPPIGLNKAVAVAAGSLHSVTLTLDGNVVGWGLNNHGQATVPVGLSNVVAISAGYDYSMALRANGTVAVWGVFDVRGLIPATVPEGLSNVVAISGGEDHCLALRSGAFLNQ